MVSARTVLVSNYIQDTCRVYECQVEVNNYHDHSTDNITYKTMCMGGSI